MKSGRVVGLNPKFTVAGNNCLAESGDIRQRVSVDSMIELGQKFLGQTLVSPGSKLGLVLDSGLTLAFSGPVIEVTVETSIEWIGMVRIVGLRYEMVGQGKGG